MADEFESVGVPYAPSLLRGNGAIEPFAELRTLLDGCNGDDEDDLLDEPDGYEATELYAWREEHGVTTSLQHLWARCGDARLLLMVRGLAAQTDSPENAWRRVAVARRGRSEGQQKPSRATRGEGGRARNTRGILSPTDRCIEARSRFMLAFSAPDELEQHRHGGQEDRADDGLAGDHARRERRGNPD